MMNSLLVRSIPLALLSLAGLTLLQAQTHDVRVKVRAPLNAQPDREMRIAKMAYGDEGSFVALKILSGNRVIGGVPDAKLGWKLYVIDAEELTEIKHDRPKFVWGIGPVAMETIESFNKRFHVILSKPDPDNGRLLLLDQVLSSRSLTGRAAALIDGIPYALFGKSPDYFKPGMAVGFTTTLSEDGGSLWIGLNPGTTIRSAGCPILGVLVDRHMKPKWTNKLGTNAGNVRTEVISTTVDTSGAVWFLIKNVTNAAPKTKEELGYNYSLYRLDSLGQKAYPLDLGKTDFVQEAAFTIMPDGRLVCAGTYSSQAAKRNESIGIFTTTLDTATGEWKVSSRIPFELQVVKKVERLQTNMHVGRIWPRSDGGLYVVAMRSGEETHLVSDLSGKKMEKTEWVNGALHVMELDATGEKKWYAVIPREMSFTNDGPGKILSLAYKDVLFVFFNDDEANMDLRKDEAPIEQVTKPKDAIMVEFKPDGDYKEKVVMDDGVQRGFFNADQVWHLHEGLYGTIGAPDFRKDRTFPILIELSSRDR